MVVVSGVGASKVEVGVMVVVSGVGAAHFSGVNIEARLRGGKSPAAAAEAAALFSEAGDKLVPPTTTAAIECTDGTPWS